VLNLEEDCEEKDPNVEEVVARVSDVLEGHHPVDTGNNQQASITMFARQHIMGRDGGGSWPAYLHTTARRAGQYHIVHL
jgi:hypothetical protein